MSELAFLFLGPPRIERDGTSVNVDRRKALALLAYLAITRRPHTRDALATLLWPEVSHTQARAGLRNALSSLKKALGEGYVVADRESVHLRIEAGCRLDVDTFQACLAQTRTHGHPPDAPCAECLSALADAVYLYRDDFLAGFTLPDSPAFDEWQFFLSEGLREDLAHALQGLTRAFYEAGDPEAALPFARRWLALDPLHEPAQRLLMRLYAGSGQRSAAVRQYAECVRVLKDELGVPPDEETAKLYQAIVKRVEIPVRAEPSPTFRPTLDVAAKHNLPVQVTPFIGREGLLASLCERLKDTACRLLTLVGPGGSGKTRLALEAATAQLDNYPNGVFFVYLAPLESADSIAPTVAQALGFRFFGDVVPRQQLLEYLRHKRILLILDSFEHLLRSQPSTAQCPPSTAQVNETGEGRESPCGTELVTDILAAALAVKVMVTSRAVLNLQGEYLFPVPGMDLPDVGTSNDAPETADDIARYGGVKLFLAGARRAQARFEPTVAMLRDIVRVCRLVDGMPLGILLAAAWTEMLTPDEITVGISNSLDFLTTDLRDMPERQRSVRAVFDHSWRLLTARDQAVVAALSVFRGGFTRRAAQQVADASLRDLKGLVEKSLLERASRGRYELHELLRQYAAEVLDASPPTWREARERHCAYYAGLLARRGQDLRGFQQTLALTDIEVDSENARRAWNWAAEQRQIERLESLLEGLFSFYEGRGRYSEGETACHVAQGRLDGIALPNAMRIQGRILAWQSIFLEGLGRFEDARHALRAGLSLLDDPALANHDTRSERAFALRQMGNLATWSGDRQEVRRCYEESLALYRELGDRWGMAAALFGLGWLARVTGAFDEAQQVLGESLSIRRQLGDRMGSVEPLADLSGVAYDQGKFDEAERLAREMVAVGRELGDRAGLALGFNLLGCALAWSGRFAQAGQLFEEGAAIYDEMGSKGWAALLTVNLGRAEMQLGHYVEAKAHGKSALEVCRHLDYQHTLGHCLDLLGAAALAQEAYDEAGRYYREGVDLLRSLQYPVALSSALNGLGAAACGAGDIDQARRSLCEALQIAARIGGFTCLLRALPTVILVLADQGDSERAIEMYGLASAQPYLNDSQWFHDVVRKRIAATSAGRAADVIAAAQERGRARDLMGTMTELAAELEATI